MEAITLPPAIANAISEAFGKLTADDVEAVQGGLSGAALYGIRVGGARYVVRHSGPRFHASELVCMRIASESGVAPRLVFADETTGIAIMERVEGGPFRRSPDGTHVVRLARALRTLHTGPAFPALGSHAEMLDEIEKVVTARGHSIPPDARQTMNELDRVTARFARTAPCHHDLNPNNILEGDNRVYFVDWEIARQGDPYLDLGQLTVFACPMPGERAALLRAYLDREPTEEESARLTLARVQALAGYVAGFSFACALHGAAPIADTAPLPMPGLFAALGAERERVKPNVVGASLLAQMTREAKSNACEDAKRVLAS